MRIKRLKLAGFKSFIEPTELKIRPGLTGVVGPNGCGKSNLLEALRWVMGESSAKSVRGSGMEDVIFAGTESRPARQFAEVSLLVERDPQEPRPGSIANDDDHELEVTRRIERGAGSAYRANGTDVRAKDIALIFADAATGAHSPALVSQGRIGAIISAKPQERRQMLEEAAGISGLHVRRKDAEQKLRAAENNLEKLSIILADMHSRANQLKRQARQAEKYRELSSAIQQGEARLIFVKWRTAKAAADAATALALSAAAEVETASAKQAELTGAQRQATDMLAKDRAAAMATRDAAGDLNGKIIALTGERDRAIQRLSDIKNQSEQLAEDSARESQLTHGAADALAQLKAENAALAEKITASDAELLTLERAAAKAQSTSRENELQLARAHASQAKAEADRRVAEAALQQASERLKHTDDELARLAQDKAQLGHEADHRAAASNAKAARDEAQQKSAASEQALRKMEDRRQSLVTARSEAQDAAAEAEAQLSAVQSEARALEKTLSQNSAETAISQITVTPGYEHALAAALGEDADAAIGGEHGRRWVKSDLPMPPSDDGFLLAHVDAPIALAKRLSMVRVAQRDDGRNLAAGERLVTMDGKLRRWDGFMSEDDGATHAEALLRANRLREITTLLPSAQAATQQKHDEREQAEAALKSLREQQSAMESQRQKADADLRAALRETDRANDALDRFVSASNAIEERRTQIAAEREIAVSAHKDAHAIVDVLPTAGTHDALAGKLEREADMLQQSAIRAQSDFSAATQTATQQRERRAVVQSEIRSWNERAGEAEKRISEMKKRRAQIAAEQAEIEGKPAAAATQLAELEQRKAGLAEKLSAMQAAEQASEAKLKNLEQLLAKAAEELSSAREARAGAAARAENEESRRIEMGRISGERFECPPPVLPAKMQFDEDTLDPPDTESSRLDQLKSQREAIGPVNLIAADELTELEEEQARSAAESEELTLAINQLRGSIGSLNREGRQRLTEAFEAVDQHFRRLFATLFNGGQAHLALIDSDDPLEAGLEIFAQPPGKKLQSLTLLSGGEQALTAVALIFALFLTNPAPICVLDEVDAPLDDANIERFCNLLDTMQRETDTRYLIVTHNAFTMSRMHRLFGVTMIEQGVSRLVSVDLNAAEELLAAE